MRQADNDLRQRDAKFRLMTEAPVRRLVLKMALPTVISMMVTAIYNVADAAFVGHLSTEATAGVGISFAYMTFIQAIGFFFGHGSGNFIARALGAKNSSHAERMAATGFFTAFLIGAAAGILGLCLLPQLCRLLGATPDIEAHTLRYLLFILAATPFMMSCLVMNNQLRLQGSAQYAMIGIRFSSLFSAGAFPARRLPPSAASSSPGCCCCMASARRAMCTSGCGTSPLHYIIIRRLCGAGCLRSAGRG